ncbi:MAG: TetR/AcrR family transcriptional regulator [Fimbriimonadaceae bacterium]|nr:TetR/AcrR family transcriptional regulator [Alphaproteobacteria bacterium]
MARTRSPDFESIQDSILDRTAVPFSSKGYAATSIEEIAAACACSKSRLYHYFESKEALLSAMLTQYVDKIFAECSEVIGKEGEPLDRFRALVKTFLDIYLVSREQHVVLLTCLDFLPDTKRQEVVQKERALVALLENLLAEMQPDLNKVNFDLSVNAMLFFGMINWTYTWYDPDGEMSVTELTDRIIDLFLHGYLRQKP